MNLFDSSCFTHESNKLFCDNVPFKKIIREVGTPVLHLQQKEGIS
jgi:hypothetical protein